MEIFHRTATRLNHLQHVVTERRFKELTGGVRIEELSQEVAGPIEYHLVELHAWYADFINILVQSIESNQNRPVIDAKEAGEYIVPRLIDRISHKLWEDKNEQSLNQQLPPASGPQGPVATA